MEQLLRVVGDDFRYVEPVYCGPELKTFPDGSVEGYFGERYKYAEFEAGKYLEACHLPFAGVDRWRTSTVRTFPAPIGSTTRPFVKQAQAIRDQGFAVCCGTAGDIDLINGISRARGMEQVLMDLIDDNPVYLEIMQARFEFFYEVQRRTLEAAGGLIDFTHAGEDFGNQRGPMIGLDIFEKHFAPKYGKYFEMVHSHGARTMLHMCGCCEAILPRLIELGLDVYDVVQPTTPSMDIAVLKERFGERLTFCGSVCVQTTLAWGTPQDVEREVRRRLELFPRRRPVPRTHPRRAGRLAAGEHPGHVPHGRQLVRRDRRVHSEHRRRCRGGQDQLGQALLTHRQAAEGCVDAARKTGRRQNRSEKCA